MDDKVRKALSAYEKRTSVVAIKDKDVSKANEIGNDGGENA